MHAYQQLKTSNVNCVLTFKMLQCIDLTVLPQQQQPIPVSVADYILS